jgi:cis-3-alkyl-4-acyloxetan-2-one decarboxylase
MINGAETFSGTWPFAPKFCTRMGFAQHYIDEGSRPADPVVLLHGEPTWGYLWRHLIGPLSATHRVIVPDHMGFGKSADPADRAYDASEHVANLSSLLVDELDLADITLVMHDWGGPIGTAFALAHPRRVSRIVAVNTFLPLGLPDQVQPMVDNMQSTWFTWAAQANADGSLEQILGNARYTVAHLMLGLQTIVRPEIMTPTWLAAYSAHFTDRAACRGAIRFPQQLVEPGPAPASPPDPVAVAALLAKPALLIVGTQDSALLARHVIAAFRAAYLDAPAIEMPSAGHFPSEDAPDAVLAALQMFLHATSVR